MNHLFSRLENAGQDRTKNNPASMHHPAVSPAERATQSAAGIPTESLPTMAAPSLIPAYAIPSRAAPGSEQSAHAIPTPPAAWPVRLWFFSLLSLIGLSVLTLALPARHALLSPQRLDDRPDARPQAATLPRSATPSTATPPAQAPAQAAPGVAPGAKPAPAAPLAIQRETRPAKPAPLARTAPLPGHAQRHPANCSEAMLAMNLCTTPPP
jgi:hypothetical protein